MVRDSQHKIIIIFKLPKYALFANSTLVFILVGEEDQEYQLVVKEVHRPLMMKVEAVQEVATRDQVQLLSGMIAKR